MPPDENLVISNTEHQQDAQTTRKVLGPERPKIAKTTEMVIGPKTSNETVITKATQEAHSEILSIHLNDMLTSMYNTEVGKTNATTLFDSGATLSCMSKRFYNRI